MPTGSATEISIVSADASSTSQYVLRKARFSDLKDIARVWHRAFFDDEIIGVLMHPHREKYPEDVYWFLLRGIRERFWIWRHQFWVVVAQDENGTERIAGAADWRRLGKGGAARELFVMDPRNLIAPTIQAYHTLSLRVFPNRAADPTQASWLDEAVAASEVYWTGDRAECWDLYVCGVHPDFQGKGVGRILASWGVNEAENEGAGTYASVLCGEKNRGFYGKAGFTVQMADNENGLALFTK